MISEQTLYKIVEPIKKTTISRLNKSKKWEYGYNKEHDIVVISKTGKIGQVVEIQGLRIGLPSEPKSVYLSDKRKWQRLEYPKELDKLKNIFDWMLVHLILERLTDCSLYSGKLVKQTNAATVCVI